jgi:hypothetical protein
MDRVFRVALVAVCEVDENQYLAANFLTHYAAMLVEQFKSPGILAKPKEVQNTQLNTAIIHTTVHTHITLHVPAASQQARGDADAPAHISTQRPAPLHQ